MKIQFEKIEEQIIKNFKGGEKETCARMFVDEKNRIMKGMLVPGASIGLHLHDTSSEIIFITGGKGKVLFDDGEERLEKGDCHYCPKGHRHSLINDGIENLEFLAVVPQQ